MNILILAEVSACHVDGGASRMLSEQAISFRNRGHKVCLLVREPVSDHTPLVFFNGIPEYHYSVNRRSTARWLRPDSRQEAQGKPAILGLSTGVYITRLNCHSEL